jgi:hypothetical protein
LIPEGRVVRRLGNPTVNQYLKVLKPIFGDQHPTMIRCSYNIWATRDNTPMMDDNASKNIMNPTSNYIVYPTWTVRKVEDQFVIDLERYCQGLVGSGLPIPQFI